MRFNMVFGAGLAAVALSVAGCTNPYDPNQRALGGAAIGAGSGAALGAIAGGGRGAAIGALVGGAVGAVGGAATTPQPGYEARTVYVQPEPVYYPPPPVYVEPAPVYVAPPVYYGRRRYWHRY